MATFTPVKATPPPARTAGGTARPAEDILAAAQVLLKDRGQWYQVAAQVANPNRWFDALKAQGASVKTRRNGDTKVERDGQTVDRPAYDVFAMIPAGEIKPHLKPSQRKA